MGWNRVANVKVEPSRSCAQISVAVVLLSVLGANSVAERGLVAPTGKHAVIVDNIGNYGRKISTTSPLAQEFFDQGLRLVYGYYFPEAIASFEKRCRMTFQSLAVACSSATVAGNSQCS